MSRMTIRPFSGTMSQLTLKPMPSLFGQAAPMGVQMAERNPPAEIAG
jgi:hypothetical protein